VLYLHDVLHLASAWYGLMLAVGAVGGVAGALIAARLAQRVGAAVTTLASLVLATAGQLLLGTTSSVIATATVMATSSMAFAIWTVQVRTTIQRTVPSSLLGRVISINRVIITAGSLAGAFLGGVAASRLGLHAPFLLGLPILIVAGVLVAGSRSTFARTSAPPETSDRPDQ
jgi:predicted MFS family arabinose efflux permease